MRYTHLMCTFAIIISAHTYVTQMSIVIPIQKVFSCPLPGSLCSQSPTGLISFIID